MLVASLPQCESVQFFESRQYCESRQCCEKVFNVVKRSKVFSVDGNVVGHVRQVGKVDAAESQREMVSDMPPAISVICHPLYL